MKRTNRSSRGWRASALRQAGKEADKLSLPKHKIPITKTHRAPGHTRSQRKLQSLPLRTGECRARQETRGRWLLHLIHCPQFSQKLGTERRASTPKTPQVKASGPSKRAQSPHGARDNESQPSPQHTESYNFPGVIFPKQKLLILFLGKGSCFVAHSGLELWGSRNPSVSATQSSGTIGMCHCSGLPNFFLT
jgi:hypothetical protein